MVLASLSFSTVIPAVLESAEFAGSFSTISRLRQGPSLDPGRGMEIAVFLSGWLGLTALLLWPQLFFPLVWLSIYFILEPINIWLGNNSLVSWLRKGDWRPIGALFAGVLITAFFWEMWNFYSYPKWIYSIPYADCCHFFEMPLLGYGGYLPFSLEIFAYVQLCSGLLGLDNYIRLLGENN